MNSKRNPKCHLLTDWKEQIVHIGDEQVSLQNQFDNLRNDFSDNSPRLDALETGLNSLDGRVIITESDIVSNTNRISANEIDIDRIEAELVNKTGDINALANRVTLAEGDIDNIDARLVGIETGEILYSQLTMDADKDFMGKAIVNPGLVDGVDVGSHVHNGEVGQGPKINLKDVEVSEDKNFGGKTLNNITDAEIKGTIHFKNSLGQMKFYYPTGEQFCSIQPRPTEGRYFQIYSYATDDAGFKFGVSKYGDVEVKGNVLMPVNGVVDGVDVSEHSHDGTAIGGAKIPIANIAMLADKNMNGIFLTNLSGFELTRDTDQIQFKPGGSLKAMWMCRPTLNRLLQLYNYEKAASPFIIDMDGNITTVGTVDGVDISAKAPVWDGKLDRVPTVASNNVKHAHDSISGNSETIFVKQKTITFNDKGPSVARVSFDIKGIDSPYNYEAKIMKNGVQIGNVQSGTGTTYVTKTQDLALNINAGDKIELWTRVTNSQNTAWVQNFRISYDIGISSTTNS